MNYKLREVRCRKCDTVLGYFKIIKGKQLFISNDIISSAKIEIGLEKGHIKLWCKRKGCDKINIIRPLQSIMLLHMQE